MPDDSNSYDYGAFDLGAPSPAVQSPTAGSTLMPWETDTSGGWDVGMQTAERLLSGFGGNDLMAGYNDSTQSAYEKATQNPLGKDDKSDSFGAWATKKLVDWGLADKSGKMTDVGKMIMTLGGAGLGGLSKAYTDMKKVGVEQKIADIKQQEQNIQNQKFQNIQNLRFTPPGILNYQPVTPQIPRIGG